MAEVVEECDSGSRMEYHYSADYYDLDLPERETGHCSKLCVWGSHGDRGYAQGRLMADEIMNVFDYYIIGSVIQKLSEQLAGYDAPTRYDSYRTKFLECFIVEPRFHDEADGIVEGLNYKEKQSLYLGRPLVKDDILAANAVVDMTQCLACSSASATRGQGAEKSMLLARNLDWENASSVEANRALSDAHAIVAHEPASDEGEKRWVSIGFAGLIGALSGMNEEGVAAVHQLATPERFDLDHFESQTKFTPINFAIRECLETIRASDEDQDTFRRMMGLLTYPSHYLVPGSNIVHMIEKGSNSGTPNAVIEHHFYPEERYATAAIRNSSAGWEDTYDPVTLSHYLAATNFHLVRRRVEPTENLGEAGDRYNKLTPDPKFIDPNVNITNPTGPDYVDYWYERSSMQYMSETVPYTIDELETNPPKTNNMHYYRIGGFVTRGIYWMTGCPTMFPEPNVKEVAYAWCECEPWRQGWDLMKSVCQYDLTVSAEHPPPRMFTWQTMVFEPDPGPDNAHVLRASFGTPISTSDYMYYQTNSTYLEPWVFEWSELFEHGGGQAPAPSPVIQLPLKLLRFVCKENSRGRRPSMSTISKTLLISSVTANQLVRLLADKALIRVVKARGRQYLQATALGRRKAYLRLIRARKRRGPAGR